MLNTVKVPKEFEHVFEKAQEYVSEYFKKKKEDPLKGTIEIFGERYIMVRAASMSVDFFETIKNLYKEQGEEEALNIARQLLFDIAHAIGRQDAKNFHNKMNLKDPIEKLSAGPIHFSHSGWAFVDIFPESKPSPDENYYLIYDHPFSFEADAWEKSGKKSDFPVCVMNAGYSSGWCEESFGVTLVASEIMCKAKGDGVCRFIMAHPSKIEGYIQDYLKKEPKLAQKIIKYEIPGFFKAKEIEEQRKKAEMQYSVIVRTAMDGFWVVDLNGRFCEVNDAYCRMIGYSREELLNMRIPDIEAVEKPEDTARRINKIIKTGSDIFETRQRRKDGNILDIEVSTTYVKEIGDKIFVFVRDITGRKKAEAELMKKMDELEAFRKVAVGRELRMRELKEKIIGLEEKLKQKP